MYRVAVEISCTVVVKVVALTPDPTVYVRVLLETVTSPVDVLTTAETIVVLITETDGVISVAETAAVVEAGVEEETTTAATSDAVAR